MIESLIYEYTERFAIEEAIKRGYSAAGIARFSMNQVEIVDKIVGMHTQNDLAYIRKRVMENNDSVTPEGSLYNKILTGGNFEVMK